MHRMIRLPGFMLSICLICCLVVTSIAGETDPTIRELLAARPVTTPRRQPVLSQHDQTYLAARAERILPVWVFFTDKGFVDQRGFDQAASSVHFTARAARRRARVGRNRILFVDLPVSNRYIDSLTNHGAELRRISRWLNAVSVNLPTDSLNTIAALPFVAEIRPVLAYSGNRDTPTEDNAPNNTRTRDAVAEGGINYGPSRGQLGQIRVPAVHDKGYSGKGVTLAIFDTGFRKSHEAFADHWANGRVLAEHDFIFDDDNTANQPEQGDVSSQWSHGTLIWSVCGGKKEGKVYGPAYEANFILCKTEDVRSETPVEEDNWVAALEWVDSLGADVVTSSLGYILWYTYDSLDGRTATITKAASMAADLGIVVCNAMGNEGSSPGSLIAPADAFDILAVGAVDNQGRLASFSSRGPTFDGRTKPEVCAQGVGTWGASASSDSAYTSASGTSLSTPLVAGAACLLLQANPNFTPQLIRQAMMETASNAATPDNNIGWGIVNTDAAVGWGAEIEADTTIGEVPLTVHFTGSSQLNPTSWWWEFGDGGTSNEQSPTHTYTQAGIFTVSLSVETSIGQITNTREGYIIVFGDTLWIADDSAYAGHPLKVSVQAQNSQPLSTLTIPIHLGGAPFALDLDSVRFGNRTSGFAGIATLGTDDLNHRYVFQLDGTANGSTLAPGRGEVLQVWTTIDRLALGSETTLVSVDPVGNSPATFSSAVMAYHPLVQSGQISTRWVRRGNVDNDPEGEIDIRDLMYLISYLFYFENTPLTVQSADVNADQAVNVADLQYLIDYLFLAGAPPPTP